MRRRIGVAGAGAWGKALAHIAKLAGHDVRMWSRGEPVHALAESDAIIVAVPAQAVRAVLETLKPVIGKSLPVIISAKGIEQSTGLFMNEVVAEVTPDARAMVLSGPSFAADVMGGLPTAVVLAAGTLAEAGEWAEALTVTSFRIYNSDDVLGVEIGGALKNVLAIACGISDGRGLGDSARAALTTRGFAELTRFGQRLGARPETLMGLSGPWRSASHLFQQAVAQLRIWFCHRRGHQRGRCAGQFAWRGGRGIYGENRPRTRTKTWGRHADRRWRTCDCRQPSRAKGCDCQASGAPRWP